MLQSLSLPILQAHPKFYAKKITMLLVMWCEINDEDHTILSRMTYLSMYIALHQCWRAVWVPPAWTPLLWCITHESCSGLVGIATDEASSNIAIIIIIICTVVIASNGLRGLVWKKLPWIVWMWCLAHTTELAISNALSSTRCFQLIDDMLLSSITFILPLSKVSKKGQRIGKHYH